MTDIVAFLAARLDEQAATLVEYVEKRHKAKMSDSFSRAFMAMDSVSAMLPFSLNPLSALSPYEHDAAIYLNADIAAKRRVMARHHAAVDHEMAWHVGACVGCGTEGEFADPRTRRVDECPELRDLAAPYAAHRDYNPAWRVE